MPTDRRQGLQMRYDRGAKGFITSIQNTSNESMVACDTKSNALGCH